MIKFLRIVATTQLIGLTLCTALGAALLLHSPAKAAQDPFTNQPSRLGGACNPTAGQRKFFGFPAWYQYLDGEQIDAPGGQGGCHPYIGKASDVWLIVAAIFEMIVRAAGIIAVVFIVWGGIQYVISQGAPDRIASARNTLTNAIMGLVFTVISARLIGFIAGRFSGAVDNDFLLPNVAAGNGSIATILSVLFQLAGGLAVIFIIWGGITYARSNGDPGTIKQAKEAIIYSIVGLLIAIFAQAIVSFTLGRT